MYGIFMESWVMFKLYGGTGFLTVLYIAALLFLLIREKEPAVRIVFIWLPLSILFLFFFPVFRKVYVRLTDSGNTQYRMLWLVPMGMTIACAACRASILLPMRGKGLLFKRFFDRLLVPAALMLLITVCGSLVYANPYVSRAENAYHLPQEAIEVCDAVARDKEEGVRVRVAMPDELVHFVRQYNTDLILAYGREIVAYGYHNTVYELMVPPEVIDMEALDEALVEVDSPFLVLRRDKKTDASPEEFGWDLRAETENYLIYKK